MTYRSKISWGLWIPLFLVLTVTSFLMLRDGAWPGIIVNALVFLLIMHLLFNTKYEISGHELLIRCGFLYRKKIDILHVSRITETNNPLSAPAASLDRLELRYDKWSTVLISPDEKEAFIATLLQINPAIEVRRKRINQKRKSD